MAPQYTAQDAINAIRGSKGFVTTIARRLGCSRTTVYALMKRYVSVREAVEDERESLKDFAESKLFQQIDSGNTTAIIFYLKTQAKDRGYIQRQEIQQETTHRVESLKDLVVQARHEADRMRDDDET